MIRSWLKRHRKLILFFLIALTASLSLLWLFEEPYNKQQWLSQPTERYRMVDNIIESQMLMQKSRAEVISFLGQPDDSLSSSKKGYLYKLGTPPSFFEEEPEHLLVIFESGTVSEVTLAVE